MKTSILFAILATIFLPFKLFAQNQYNYLVNLKNVTNDQVSITLQTPDIQEDTVVFSFPKAIPGSYSEKDFGRFIKDFKAYNKKGKMLPVEKINNTQYKISKAQTLQKISYKVSDTWDMVHSNYVFQPGGTNIEADKNFVINNHAFFGYFEGYKMLPFNLSIIKPATLYGSTHLQVDRKTPELDLLKAKDYIYLADNPIMYSVPDTTSFLAGKTRINISVYSATGKVNSLQIASYLKPMSVALTKFFNGLPVDSYQFLYYFVDPDKALTGKDQGGYGALEHNYSSLYYLPEVALESRLHSLVNEVSSHEFLHIQTPLNLHSEEIENFDYINPKMSQHLWLYEGVTEYFAHLVQVQNGLMDEKEFFEGMKEKVEQAEEFGLFSMTEMSKKVLTEEYKSKYNSVYNKGALIGFMLDLFIREKTNQTKDLKTVIQVLAAKYGPNKPFKDDELFDELIKASHPDVAGFIDNYIKGSKELPLSEMLATIGYEYSKAKQKSVFNIGEKLSLKYDEPSKKFVFSEVGNNALGIKNGDVLTRVQDIAVTENSLNELWEKYIQTNTSFPELTIGVNRKGIDTVLTGRLNRGTVLINNYIGPLETSNEAQRKNLDKLLGR